MSRYSNTADLRKNEEKFELSNCRVNFRVNFEKIRVIRTREKKDRKVEGIISSVCNLATKFETSFIYFP